MLTGTGNAIDFRSIIDESGVQVSYANENYEWPRSSGLVFRDAVLMYFLIKAYL